MKNQSIAVAVASLTLLSLVSACGPLGAPTSGVTVMAVPSGPGSMGPNLSKGHDGITLVSWIEPEENGHALKFSRLQGRYWSPATFVSRGNNWFDNWADFPSVVALSKSLWASHWLVSQPAGGYAYDVNIALSSDSGRTWSESFLPHKDDTPTEHGFVTLFNDGGNVGAVWLDGRKNANEYVADDIRATGMTLRAGAYSDLDNASDGELLDDLICDCCQTDVALTTNGPVAIYRNRTVDEYRDIYVSRRIDDAWQPGTPVGNDQWAISACPVNGPIIQANGDTVAAVWFTAANEKPMVKAAWSDDAGQSFAEPIEIDTQKPFGRTGAALLPNGDLVVSWLRSIGDGRAALLLKRISPNGQHSADYAVTDAADIFAFSFPQIVSKNSDLVLVWTTEIDETLNIASAIVPIANLPLL